MILGGSHGSVGSAYGHLGKRVIDVSLKRRGKIMFEILKHKTGKNYDPD